MKEPKEAEISSLEKGNASAQLVSTSSRINESPSKKNKPIQHFRALADVVLVATSEDSDFGLSEEEQRQMDAVLEETGRATSRFGIGAIEVYAFKNPRLIPIGFWISNQVLENPHLTENDIELLMEPQVSYPNMDLVGLLWSMDVHPTETMDRINKPSGNNPRRSSLSIIRRRSAGEGNESDDPEVPGSIESCQNQPGQQETPRELQRRRRGGGGPQRPRERRRQKWRERVQEKGLHWRELKSVIDDPDQSHGPRTRVMYKAGLDKATGIPFSIAGHQGMIVYYAVADADSSLTTSPVHEAYLKRATQVKGAVLATIVTRRLLDAVHDEVPNTPASHDTMVTEATTSPPQTLDPEHSHQCRNHFVAWLKKIKGGGAQTPPCMSWSETAWTFVGSFIGSVIMYLINEAVQVVTDQQYFLISGPFGALLMLQYGLIGAPASQPRSIIYGLLLSGTISLLLTYIPDSIIPAWLRLVLAPALSIAAMMRLGVPCPPASAISVIFAEGLHNWRFFGWTLAASLLSILIAMAFNNLNPRRQYPTFWRLGPETRRLDKFKRKRKARNSTTE